MAILYRLPTGSSGNMAGKGVGRPWRARAKHGPLDMTRQLHHDLIGAVAAAQDLHKIKPVNVPS